MIPTALKSLGLNALTVPRVQDMPTSARLKTKARSHGGCIFYFSPTWLRITKSGMSVNTQALVIDIFFTHCARFLLKSNTTCGQMASLFTDCVTWGRASYLRSGSLSVSSVKWGSNSAYLTASAWGCAGWPDADMFNNGKLSPLTSQKPGCERESVPGRPLWPLQGSSGDQ